MRCLVIRMEYDRMSVLRVSIGERVINQVPPFVVAFIVSAMSTLLFPVSAECAEEHFQSIRLKSTVTEVQPMTGIVLWTTNEEAETAPMQLEFTYMTFRQIVKGQGVYDWSALEKVLKEVASRKHQLILRWHDTYVGKKTGVPKYITELANYKLVKATSEGELTEFPDWSHPELRRFARDFFTRFAQRYDNDPRLAFVQVGFGLWAEYHIYDGPMKLGQTFPAKELQAEFAQHLAATFRTTPWMISVDAGDDERSAFPGNPELLSLSFGLFDDSFNHAKHKKENEPNWNILGRDRWQRAPTGGEFSFFRKADQTKALAPNGPHGIPFEQQAADFHVSFIVGDDQPRFQKPERIRSAGAACGYRFQVEKFEASMSASRVVISNTGVAPIYYDAFPAVNGVPSTTSLKGLLPGERRSFEIPAGGAAPKLTIECERLVPGQTIGFDANLP